MEAIRAIRWGIALVLAASAIGCSSGSPAQSSCKSNNETVCGSSCYNLQEDSNNCGTCSNKCGDGKSCKAGKCVSNSGSTTGGGSSVGGSSNKGGTGSANGGSSSSSSDSSNGGSSSSNSSTNDSNGGSSSSNGGSSTATSKGGTSSSNGGTSSGSPKGGSTGTAKGGTSNTGAGGASSGGANNTAKGGTSTANGGSSVTPGGAPSGGAAVGGAAPAGGSSAVPTGPCSSRENVISNFEEGTSSSEDPVVLAQTGVVGKWEMFNNAADSSAGSKGTQTLTVEDSGDTSECHKFALHTTGKGWGSAASDTKTPPKGWVGIGLTHMLGTKDAPTKYDATAKQYTGVTFRAKKGSGHSSKAPVRFNVSIPETEGTGSGGKCTDVTGTTEKADRVCYQHVGRYLAGDVELTTEWKTFTFCFDRDLYPLSLPSNLSNAQRDSIGSNILKFQFQFNKGRDYSSSSYPQEGLYPYISTTEPFDLWVDEIAFSTGACPEANFASSGAKAAFPQNKGVGSCEIAANAAKFNTAVSRAYATWTKNFVRDGNRIVAPEQEGKTTSEAMGYGMLIAAAMGDKTTFGNFWGYVKTKLNGNGLMKWDSNDNGSATDGDVDIAYALMIADMQWGGYSGDATKMVDAIKGKDVSGDKLKPGDSWETAFNPSYFAPSYFKAFTGMDSVITAGYSRIKTNTGSNFPTDWTDWSGQATTASGAQVVAGFNSAAYGYDAARVPWRVGLGGCAGDADGKAIAKTIIDFFAAKYDSGATIDLMKAGWIKSSGSVASASDAKDGSAARDMQGSFIGPLGVGAMASGNAAVRDRAFRTILDIMENGDFNHTYFPSTVGLITLLIMSGNFPTP